MPMNARVSRAIETFLFVLTGHRWCVLSIAVMTLTSWVVLSDYMMANRFPWWQSEWESTAFLWGAAAAPVVAAVWSRFRVDRALRAIRPMVASGQEATQLVELAPVTGTESAETVQVLIRTVLDLDAMRPARSFLAWKHDRLDTLGSRPQRAWWHSGRAWRQTWPRVLWLPALSMVLFVAPSLPLFERVVSMVSGLRVVIFDIVAEGNVESTPAPGRRVTTWVQESLLHTPRTSVWRRSESGQLYVVTLRVKATSFPHLTHRLQAICAGKQPQCEIVLANGAVKVSQIEVPVRNGQALLQLYRLAPDPSLDLRLWLVRANGTVVDEASIEPLDDPQK